jgi:hypothetical protein
MRMFRQMPTALRPRRWSPILLTAALAAALAPPAAAKHGHHGLAPPGNSGIGQYVEIIPTASGSRPTNTVHNHGGGQGGAIPTGPSAASGTSASSGTSSSSGTLAPVPEWASAGSSGVSGATAQALAAQGSAGQATANLARATNPGGATLHQAGPVGPPAPIRSVGGASSPVGSVLGTLTGSSSSGGLGALLPVLLIIALVGAGAMALLRHRRTT